MKPRIQLEFVSISFREIRIRKIITYNKKIWSEIHDLSPQILKNIQILNGKYEIPINY